jgi:hypothetical protein
MRFGPDPGFVVRAALFDLPGQAAPKTFISGELDVLTRYACNWGICSVWMGKSSVRSVAIIVKKSVREMRERWVPTRLKGRLTFGRSECGESDWG